MESLFYETANFQWSRDAWFALTWRQSDRRLIKGTVCNGELNSEAAYPASSIKVLLMGTHQWWPPVRWWVPSVQSLCGVEMATIFLKFSGMSPSLGRGRVAPTNQPGTMMDLLGSEPKYYYYLNFFVPKPSVGCTFSFLNCTITTAVVNVNFDHRSSVMSLNFDFSQNCWCLFKRHVLNFYNLFGLHA